MRKTTKEQINIGQFTVFGTSNLLVANGALQRLLASQRCGLQEARYKVGGKTIVIKPLKITEISAKTINGETQWAKHYKKLNQVVWKSMSAGELKTSNRSRAKQKQFYATTVIIPAEDTFSRPIRVQVNSKMPFGEAGNNG